MENAEGRKVDWAEVRRVYELTDAPTVLILKKFGLTESQLRWRRESEGWEARLPAAGDRHSALAPRRLRNRLFALHGTLLSRLEAWVAASENFSEEQARALAALAGSLGSITEAEESEERMAKAMRQPRKERTSASTPEKKNHDAGYDFRDDPAWLDAELARRLDRRFGGSGVEGDMADAHSGGEAAGAGDVADRVGKG